MPLGDLLFKLFPLFLILYFGYKYAIKHYGADEPEEVEDLKKRKEEKLEQLKLMKKRYAHLSDEITITDDLILMKNNVELSEDELNALDEALAEEKVTAETPAEASEGKEKKE